MFLLFLLLLFLFLLLFFFVCLLLWSKSIAHAPEVLQLTSVDKVLRHLFLILFPLLSLLLSLCIDDPHGKENLLFKLHESNIYSWKYSVHKCFFPFSFSLGQKTLEMIVKKKKKKFFLTGWFFSPCTGIMLQTHNSARAKCLVLLHCRTFSPFTNAFELINLKILFTI